MNSLSLLCLATLLLGLTGCETTNTAKPAVTAAPPVMEPASKLDTPPVMDSSAKLEQPAELLDRRPVRRFVVQPVYPFELRKEGISGRVVVEFIIDTNGNVVNAFAVSASHPALAQPAVDAISLWKFSPGMKNGRAVNCRMRQSMAFSLGETK